jgi:L-asparaginase
MRHVLLVATGDTIAYRPGRSRIATGAELLATVGSLPVKVTVEDVMAEPSWDTSPGTMLGLARRVRKALADDGFDGVVVTHGVDTVEETAFLTDLLVTARGGIVFTGAFRHLDAPDSDGPANLAASLAAAADPKLAGKGALICLDEKLHAARFFTLRHVIDGGVDIAEVPGRWPEPKGEPETDVALIKTYPGMTSAAVNAVVDAGARGVVLEGTGSGSVPGELFTTIHELTGWDIPVVIASRFAARGQDIGPMIALRMGAISAGRLSAGHARIALMVALGGGVDAARDWFATIPDQTS